jgi:dihydrofolate reductase
MRKIIVTEFITIDNVIEDPGGSEGCKFGGWNFKFFNEEFLKYKLDELMAADGLMLGRKTYDGFASVWPGRDDEAGFARKFNEMEKFLVSSTTSDPIWGPCTLIKGNIWGQVREIKARPGGDILVNGSAMLVNGLLANGLVDELRLLVHPIVLGEGKRLFAEGLDSVTMAKASIQPFSNGAYAIHYEPVKEPA